MFNQQELQILIGGVDTAIDIDDLRANTVYGGLYDENEPTIQMFWKASNDIDVGEVEFGLSARQVVSELKQEQKQALLRFVTSCGRPPLLCVFIEQSCFSRVAQIPPRLTVVSNFFHPSFPSATLARTKDGCRRLALA